MMILSFQKHFVKYVRIWGFDIMPRSRSRIVLIRRWATGGMGKPVVRPAMPGSRHAGGEERDEGDWREHAGPWPGPTRVSGEWRAPATSQHPIRTGNDAGTTRRALLAPLPFALPSSLFSAARRRVFFSILSLSARSRSSRPSSWVLRSSLTLLSFILSLLLPSLLLCVGYYRLQNLMMYHPSFGLYIYRYNTLLLV